MANETFTATQATVLATDNDAPDGVIDPGDVVTTTVTITNNSTTPTPVAATGVQFTETLDGMTIVDQPGDDINVSPIAFDDAYNVVGNTTFVVSAADGILNGSTATHVTLSADAEFFTNTIGANPLTQTHIVTTGVIDTAGGSVTLNADGSFTYTPDAGFTGPDSFTYTLTDAGLDGNFATAGDNLTGTGTVTFNVEDTVWFIDNTAPGSLNLGTQDNPFTSIAAFNAVNDGVGNHPAAGDIVYLREGTYTEADGINLLNNQTLVGQGENLVVNHSLGGNITLETGSAGQTPVIVVTGAGNQGIQLAQGNTISGLDVGMNNATAVGIADGGGTVGNLTISNVGVGVGSNLGSAVDIDQGGTLNVLLESVTSTGAARGIDLGTTTGLAGTGNNFTVSGLTTINDATGDGIAIGNSSLNANFTGLVTIVNDVGSATVADGVDLGTGAGGANTGNYSFNGGVNLTVNGTNAFGLSAQNSGTVNIADPGGTTTQITSVNGSAILINPTTFNATLDSITAGGGTNGVSLTGMTGTLTINGGSITGATGADININGGTGNFTYNGTITDDVGQLVAVANKTAGTTTFGGTITDGNDGDGSGITVSGNTGGTVNFNGQTTLSTGANTAINLSSNTGATINFNAGGNGLDITTSTGVGFNATGGGTVAVQGSSNSINSGTGTALNIANTTIGANDVTFQSISANGAVSGIVLNTTGTSGGLTVTGDAGSTVNSSGGTIQNTTGHGISLTDTRNVSLDQMNIVNTANDGINGSSVTNFNFTNSTVSGAGDGANEFGVFITNLLGTNTINNSSITNSETQNLRVLNNVATLGTLTISNSVFTGTSVANGSDAINVISEGSGNLTVNLTDNNDLNNTQGDGIQGSAAGSGTLRLTVDGSNSNYNGNLGSAVNIAAANNSHIIALIQDFNGVSTGTSTLNGLNVFNIQNLDTSTIEATVQNNVISGIGNNAAGIRVIQEGTGTVTAELDNNTITGLTSGIFGQARASATPGLGTLNLTIHNNTVTLTDPVANDGIDIQSGSSAGTDRNTVNLDLFNNNSSSTPASQSGYRLAITTQAVFRLEDFTGNGTSTADVQAWVNNAPKSNIGTVQVVLQAGASFGTIADVTEPSLPLLAAAGGVEAVPSTDNIPPADDTAAPAYTSVQDNSGTTPLADEPPPAHFDPLPAPAHPVIVDDGVLTQAELDYVVDAAVVRWSEAGLTQAQLHALEAMSFGVADLSGLNLGSFTPAQITLDADAAGHGWYLDGTPRDDAEFGHAQSATRLTTDPTQAPAGHYDLLTTVMHEMGHALGLGDRYEGTARDALMYGWLFTGERRVPGAGEADGAVAGSITTEEFAGSPIAVTPANSTTGAFILPAGKQVVIQWQATVDPQSNQLIDNPSNQGTVSATNAVGFPDKLTDDPAVGGANDPTVTTLDTLVLGGTVWNDDGAGGGIAANGIKDGTEPGVSGVTLSLFVDADDNNVPDSPASPLVTGVLTNGSGDYSFTGLAPGNYIVRVDAGNFTGAGALVSLQLSPVTSPEPRDPDTGDPDVDNDDNGSRAAGQPAFSNAITLAYNTEPTAGTGNDTNTTLDFGFLNNPIQVVKFVNGQDADSATGPHVAAGSTVTFTYVVTDTGGAPLANVALTDDKLGPITSFTGDTNGDGLLDPTETWTYTATATALAGQQTNVGTVTGQDFNTLTTVTDDNPANYFGDAAAINIVKFVNGQDADSAPGAHVAAGSTVTFTYVVTDTGNVPLSGVVVQDDNGTAANTADDFNPTFSGGDTNANGLLDLTETWTYTQTATALAGQQTNVGTVTGQDVNSPPGTTVTDDNPANYFGDPIHIVKLVNGQDADSATGPHVAAGSTVTFTYVVTDTGGAPVANVAVTDDKLGPITSFTGDTNGDGLLDPTETWTYTATATALAGQQTNVGTVTGQDFNTLTTVTDDNPANYFGDAPAINIVKFVNGQDADSATGPHVAPGSTVTFTYVVTDTGNVPLANVTLTDDKLGLITSFTGDANANGLLDLTETWTYTATATALAGQQTNVGTVTGQDANSPPGTTVTDDNPANYFGDFAAGIQIVKFVNGQDADSATGPHVAAGSTVTFTYVVTDTGGVPVANVALTDDKLGPITSFTGDTNGDGLLDPTETWTYTAAAIALAGQQTNVGTVTGQDVNTLTTVTDDNPANYFGDAAGINLVKFVNGQDADSATGPHVAAGSTVTFTYVVTDTGNVPLANVTVTDDKLGAITSFTGDANANGLLDLTETWIYTQTATALAGQQTNVGTVTGQDANSPPGTTVTDDNPANYFGDAAAVPPPKSDFDGDSKSDIAWQSNNGTAAIWLMDGTNSTFVGAVGPFNPGPTWHMKATGDFNGDSKADIIWQHDNGLTAMWLMDGTNATFVGAVGPFNPEAPWEIKGTGDFNGDGKDDIIWQHDNGLTAMWQMDGTNATFVGAVGPFNPGATWEIKGTGDFNGDGKDDIIWQGDDGTAAIWLMDGTNATFVGAVGPFNPGPSWEIKGTGDFNGDGKSDIIWQGQDGTPAIWLMDGTNATFAGAVGPFNPGPSWHIEGAGDFNGDGKDDILWQNDDGTPAIWTMDGTNVVSIGAAGSFNPGSDWQVIV